MAPRSKGATPSKPKPRKLRWAGLATLAITAIVCAVGLFLYVQWSRVPDYWQQNQRFVDRTPEPTLRKMGNDLENRLLSAVSQVGRNGEPDETVRIPFDDANAWLRTRLDDWARQQGIEIPKVIDDFTLARDSSKPVLGFRLKTPEVDQVITVRLDVTVDEQAARVRLDRVQAGRLTVPLAAIAAHLEKTAPDHQVQQLQALLHGEPFEPVYDHPGHSGKRLRVTGFQLHPEGVELTLRAEDGG